MDSSKNTLNHLHVDADGENAVLIFLLNSCVGKGVLQRGAIKAAANKFSVSDDTVRRIWKLREKIDLEVSSSFRRVLGKVRLILYEQRESLADAMGMAKSAINDHAKAGNFRWAPCIVMPVLTDCECVTDWLESNIVLGT